MNYLSNKIQPNHAHKYNNGKSCIHIASLMRPYWREYKFIVRLILYVCVSIKLIAHICARYLHRYCGCSHNIVQTTTTN